MDKETFLLKKIYPDFIGTCHLNENKIVIEFKERDKWQEENTSKNRGDQIIREKHLKKFTLSAEIDTEELAIIRMEEITFESLDMWYEFVIGNRPPVK